MSKVAASSGHFHAVRFYENAESLSRIVAEFLADGFLMHQPAIVIGREAHRVTIEQELVDRGFDVARLKDTGQLAMLDATKVLSQFMVDGMPDAARFRAAIVPAIEQACRNRKPCVVRAYGEMVDILWRDGHTVAATRLEMLWNELARTHDFSLLCGYSMGNFYKDASVEEICNQHSHILSETGEAAARH